MTACSSDSSADGTATVRFLGHTGLQASMDEVIKQFEAANPTINIEAEYSPAGLTYGQTLAKSGKLVRPVSDVRIPRVRRVLPHTASGASAP